MKRILAFALAAALLLPFGVVTSAATLRGDADGDGAVTSTDARLALQFSVGKIGESDLDLKACDADGDGKVTSTDARLILQMSVGKIELAKYIPLYPWAENLPRMDGSTSTIPLEAGIRAALLGLSRQETEAQVTHTTTYNSYSNLLNGDCDLIFTVPLSEEQIAEAERKGISLAMEKIAAEGFVFVVNAQNPVDTLTRQQIKDIYSGKITNWKEVGGNDAPIVAYQRNETSGSQNFMHTFMGDTPLMKPVTAFIPSSMGGLINAVALYDNGENAIGYSVYAYAADMYGYGEKIKFIQVDGVAPTIQTMASGDYPLLGYNYAIFNDAAPADSSLRKLVAWLTTEEGQRAIRDAGYVPVFPVEEGEPFFIPYNEVGTGPERPEGHLPSLVWYRVGKDAWSHSGERARLSGLKNKELQGEINAFIDGAIQELAEGYGCTLTYECINGYLSVAVRGHMEDTVKEFRTAIYDLVEGRRISFTDLFFKGEEIVPAINRALREKLDRSDYIWTIPAMKRDFAGLEAGHSQFTLTSICLDVSSVYLNQYLVVPLKDLYGKSVLSVPRDLTGVFEENVQVVPALAAEEMFVNHEPLFAGGYDLQSPDGAVYDPAVCEKIRSAALAMAEGEMSKERAASYYGFSAFDCEAAGLSVALWGDRYIRMTGAYWHLFSGDTYINAVMASRFFSAETGEEVPYADLLQEGWLQAAVWYSVEDGRLERLQYIQFTERDHPVSDGPDLSAYRLADLGFTSDGQLAALFQPDRPGEGSFAALLPPDWLK